MVFIIVRASDSELLLVKCPYANSTCIRRTIRLTPRSVTFEQLFPVVISTTTSCSSTVGDDVRCCGWGRGGGGGAPPHSCPSLLPFHHLSLQLGLLHVKHRLAHLGVLLSPLSSAARHLSQFITVEYMASVASGKSSCLIACRMLSLHVRCLL